MRVSSLRDGRTDEGKQTILEFAEDTQKIANSLPIYLSPNEQLKASN